MNQSVAVAVCPVDYHLDGAGGVLASNAVGIILSTYDQEITNRLIDLIKIEQKK